MWNTPTTQPWFPLLTLICSIVPSLHMFRVHCKHTVSQPRLWKRWERMDGCGGTEWAKEKKRKKAGQTFFKIVLTAPKGPFYLDALIRSKDHTEHALKTQGGSNATEIVQRKTLSVTLNCTPPKWIAVVLAPKVRTGDTFSYPALSTRSLFLTHCAHWKPTALWQTRSHLSVLFTMQTPAQITSY